MQSKARFAHKAMRRQGGFTRTELTLSISVLIMLAAFALPSLIQRAHDARIRATMQKLMGDVVWLRKAASAQADGRGVSAVSLTVNADCSWSASVHDRADTAHSMSSASLDEVAPGLHCTSSGATSLPLTFSFSQQGAIAPTSLLTYSTDSGKRWSLQVMTSGAVLINSDPS